MNKCIKNEIKQSRLDGNKRSVTKDNVQINWKETLESKCGAVNNRLRFNEYSMKNVSRRLNFRNKLTIVGSVMVSVTGGRWRRGHFMSLAKQQ